MTNRIMTGTKTLLTAVALTAGMSMVLDGCAPAHASAPRVSPVAKGAPTAVAPNRMAGVGAKLASLPMTPSAPSTPSTPGAAKLEVAPAPKPVAKTVTLTKPKVASAGKPHIVSVKPCVRKVRRMIGNGKGASYSQKSWTCEPAGTTS